MEEKKKINGITLIALVITIIVLLILAGVTIATLGGDNGIIARAKTAQEKNAYKKAEEEVKIVLNAYQTEKYQKEETTLGEYLEIAKNNNEIDEYSTDETKEGIYIIERDGYQFEINEKNLEIESSTGDETIGKQEGANPGVAKGILKRVDLGTNSLGSGNVTSTTFSAKDIPNYSQLTKDNFVAYLSQQTSSVSTATTSYCWTAFNGCSVSNYDSSTGVVSVYVNRGLDKNAELIKSSVSCLCYYIGDE